MPLRELPHQADADNALLLGEEYRRGACYAIADLPAAPYAAEPVDIDGYAPHIPLTEAAIALREAIRQPLAARRTVGYNRAFLEAYEPNVSFYLDASERAHLACVGKPRIAEQPAGSYARQTLNRLLIELSWNSSRLEGNSYSLLDTARLFEWGEQVDAGSGHDALMILNHKRAIEYLVEYSAEVRFDRQTILGLHALLSEYLLPDSASGSVRYIDIGIGSSVFQPLRGHWPIDECFNIVLAKADAIVDPFEQALFVMAQLPYLQPFEEVNKRVSRLAANIPFIKSNLSPLSFADVPTTAYVEAILAVYEGNGIALLKDTFIWAYERSAARYVTVREGLGAPDPHWVRLHGPCRQLIGELVRSGLPRTEAAAFIAAWADAEVDGADRALFIDTVEQKLLALHPAQAVRYRLRPEDIEAWRSRWKAGYR